MSFVRRFALIALLFALGCSKPSGPPPVPDASGVDAGGDASGGDAGVDGSGTDGSTPDAAGPDGMVSDGSTDAASTDGSAADAASDGSASDGSTRDGATDAGPSDAAVDATSTDAAVDSGPVSMPCTAVGTCDPFDPTACAADEKCLVTATGTACTALTMTPGLAEGATCTRDTDCAAGTWCVSFGAGFVCTATCAAGSIGQCGADATCLGTVGSETCVRVCLPTPTRCNIYTQDCADPTYACTLTRNSETGERYTGCLPAGTQARGDACGGSSGRCAAGLICINQSGTTTCRQVCGADGGVPTCSAAGENCTGFASSWGIPYCR